MSFIEVVATVVLMGIVIVPLLSLVTSTIRSSSVTGESAKVETVLLNAVDRVNRATRGDFPCDFTAPVRAAVQVENWPISTVSVKHEYYDSTKANPWVTDPSGTACPNGVLKPNLVQRVTITITGPDTGVTRKLEVVKGDV
jgi:hypothetical protein